MSPTLQHHFSSLHARSTDSNGTHDSASHFDCHLKHTFMLKENAKYFIYLNSISIPVDLTCKVLKGKDSFLLEYSNDTMKGEQAEKKLERGLADYESMFYKGRRAPDGEVDEFWAVRGSLSCIDKFHETISHCHHLGGEEGVNERGLKYFIRNVFNRWTNLGRYVKVKIPRYSSTGEEDRVSCSIKLRDSIRLSSITFGDSMGSILGFNEKKVQIGEKRLKSITLEHDSLYKPPGPRLYEDEMSSRTNIGSGEKLIERRSHIYLECSICEGNNIGGSFRKLLKVIPVAERFCSGRYLTYDVPFPEYVKIEGINIQNIRFTLRDADGEIIDSTYTKLPTILTCSILEE